MDRAPGSTAVLVDVHEFHLHLRRHGSPPRVDPLDGKPSPDSVAELWELRGKHGGEGRRRARSTKLSAVRRRRFEEPARLFRAEPERRRRAAPAHVARQPTAAVAGGLGGAVRWPGLLPRDAAWPRRRTGNPDSAQSAGSLALGPVPRHLHAGAWMCLGKAADRLRPGLVRPRRRGRAPPARIPCLSPDPPYGGGGRGRGVHSMHGHVELRGHVHPARHGRDLCHLSRPLCDGLCRRHHACPRCVAVGKQWEKDIRKDALVVLVDSDLDRENATRPAGLPLYRHLAAIAADRPEAFQELYPILWDFNTSPEFRTYYATRGDFVP